MGILLKWKRPSSEANYDTVRVFRSDSETGTFVLIHSQTILDNSYYDPEGKNSYWYKIAFYDSVLDISSNSSSATQGSERIGYASVDDVRSLTNIASNQVNDTDLAIMIEFAAGKLNSDLNHRVEREIIEEISEVKLNTIDGTNLTFYTKNYPLGDSNNDFSVTPSDIQVYSIDDEGNENLLVVTQVTASTGQFKLSSAPNDVKIYVTYQHTDKISVDPPHSLVKLACIQLASSLAYSKINLGKAPRFKQGPLTVFRDTTAHKQYLEMYHDTLQEIST